MHAFGRRRLKRLAIGLVAAVLIAGGLWLAAPLFITTNANVPAPGGFSHIVREGTWQGADDFHYASGRARVLGDGQGHYVLRVEDFSIRNGPDIEFFLSADASYDPGDVGLGDVGATTGSYNVAIPDGVDVGSLTHAIVWCVPFGVLFGTAVLR